MFEETLIGNTKSHLALLGNSGLLKNAYLAGGTAAALQLGHRISADFDFFTSKDFDPKTLVKELLKLGSFQEDQADQKTVLGTFNDTKFSLFFYEYPLIYDASHYLSLNIADIRDIAAMKIDAIASRGAKRDFIDLYFISKSGCSLRELLNFYDRRYGRLASNLIHIQKSLVYFEDAEKDEMPRLLKHTGWQEVKKFFMDGIKEIQKKIVS